MIFTALSDGRFDLGDRWTRCALGKGGLASASEKVEGDGKSPIGVWPLRRVLYRGDRISRLECAMTVGSIERDDGWCDDPKDPAYNRPVKLPYAARAERLWREDEVYDVIVVLGFNDDPPRPFAGSAIFLHAARRAYPPTEGCVALALVDLLDLVSRAVPGDAVAVLPRPGQTGPVSPSACG